jgi:hypothetical protein
MGERCVFTVSHLILPQSFRGCHELQCSHLKKDEIIMATWHIRVLELVEVCNGKL